MTEPAAAIAPISLKDLTLGELQTAWIVAQGDEPIEAEIIEYPAPTAPMPAPAPMPTHPQHDRLAMGLFIGGLGFLGFLVVYLLGRFSAPPVAPAPAPTPIVIVPPVQPPPQPGDRCLLFCFGG
jgi:hypothetical protein